MSTVIERLEALAEKQCEVDWDEDDLSELHGALPDLLKVVRAAFADIASRECEEAPFGPCGKCDYCTTKTALEPLFREAQQ